MIWVIGSWNGSRKAGNGPTSHDQESMAIRIPERRDRATERRESRFNREARIVANDPSMSINLESGGITPDWSSGSPNAGDQQGNQAEQKQADGIQDIVRVLEALVSKDAKQQEATGPRYDESTGRMRGEGGRFIKGSDLERMQEPKAPDFETDLDRSLQWQKWRQEAEISSRRREEELMASVPRMSDENLAYWNRQREMHEARRQSALRELAAREAFYSPFDERGTEPDVDAGSSTGRGGGGRRGRRTAAGGEEGDDEVRPPNIADTQRLFRQLSHAIPQLGPGAGLGQMGAMLGSAAGLGMAGTLGLAAGAAVGGAVAGYYASPYISGWFAERQTFRDEYVQAQRHAGIARAFSEGAPAFAPPETDPRSIITQFVDPKDATRERLDQLRKKQAERVRRAFRATPQMGWGPMPTKEDVLLDEEIKQLEQQLNAADRFRSGVAGDVIPVLESDIDPQKGGWGYLGLLKASLRNRGVDTDKRMDMDARFNRFHRPGTSAENALLEQDDLQMADRMGAGPRGARSFNTLKERDMEGRKPLQDRIKDPILDINLKELEKFDDSFERQIEKEIEQMIDPVRFHFGSFAYGGLTA
ncbi:MAG TPA: hypothetical protein PKU94_08260 [Candidatus Hydrothermia bacterium]|nr:hypothetical protein [Candidatus Hydrothermia bacterium]